MGDSSRLSGRFYRTVIPSVVEGPAVLRLRPCRSRFDHNTRPRGERYYAKNHSILMVRRQSRGGNEFLYLHFQELKDWTDYSQWRSRARPCWKRTDYDIPARKTGFIALNGAPPSSSLRPSRSLCTAIRRKKSMSFGRSLRRWREEPMRLAEGQVWPLLAIVPSVLSELMGGKDPEKCKRDYKPCFKWTSSTSQN